MNKNMVLPILGFLLITLCFTSVVGWMIYTVNQWMNDPSYQAALVADVSTTDASTVDWSAVDWQSVFQVAGWIIALIVAFLVLKWILDSGHALTIFIILGGIALIVLLANVFVYGDKNGDGEGDVMVLAAVQPTGDLTTDQGYAEVNSDNAMANVKNAASFTIYAGMILLGVIVFSGVAIVVKARG